MSTDGDLSSLAPITILCLGAVVVMLELVV